MNTVYDVGFIILCYARLHNNNDENDNNNNNMKLEENYKVNFWMTSNFNNDVYINVLKQSRSQSHELIHAFKTLLGGFNNYFYVLKTINPGIVILIQNLFLTPRKMILKQNYYMILNMLLIVLMVK